MKSITLSQTLKCCIISACKRPAPQGMQVMENKEPISIPGVTVIATDTLLTINNGNWYYAQQLYSGSVISFFPSGRIKTRQRFYEGKEEGASICFYEDGSIDAWRWYHMGEKDSVNKGWWPNGNARFEYHFENGIYEGDFKEWYESGSPLKHIVYKNGKEVSGRGWRANGKMYMSFEVRNGRMYGLINPNLCYSLQNERGEFVTTVP
jgi:hypothetical protein